MPTEQFETLYVHKHDGKNVITIRTDTFWLRATASVTVVLPQP